MSDAPTQTSTTVARQRLLVWAYTRGPRSTALGRRRARAFVWLSDSLGMVRDIIVVTAPVTPGSSGPSSSGTTREWALRSSRV
jgi:hypothetical protein